MTAREARQTRTIMGMPVQLEILRPEPTEGIYEQIFAYFTAVDERFSTYKKDSEISRINRGEIPEAEYSSEMREVFALAKEISASTNGYFDIRTPEGTIDPSGIVKGWAIQKAAEQLRAAGYTDFYIEIAGDIQTAGKNAAGEEWSIGIRNPFNRDEIVKVVYPKGQGIATSGTAVRGAHIYNPHTKDSAPADLASLTVLGPNVYEADCIATAAFAMGITGLMFIENLSGFEAYAISPEGIATYTSGFLPFTNP